MRRTVITATVVMVAITLFMTGVFLAHEWQRSEQRELRDGSAGPWPMFQQNARHTGLSPYDTSSNDGTVLWNYTVEVPSGYDGVPISTPVVDGNGTIYVGVTNNNDQGVSTTFLAIYPNGTLKWSLDLGYGVSAPAAIDENGTIYANNDYGEIYAIYPNGTLKWHLTVAPDIAGYSAPTIGDDGTIYVCQGGDPYLTAIRPDGTIKWRVALNTTSTDISPAIGNDGTIYVGTAYDGSINGELYAVNPDGSVKWSRTLPVAQAEVHSPVIEEDGTIYVPVISEGAVAYLYAFDPYGSLKWSYPDDASFMSITMPAIGSDGNLYFMGDGPEGVQLTVLDTSGRELWNHTFSAGSFMSDKSAPSIGYDGTIYVGYMDDNGSAHIAAVSKDNTVRWETVLDGAQGLSNFAVDANGVIYIGTENSTLYAIGPQSSVPEMQSLFIPAVLTVAVLTVLIRRR